MEDNSNIHVLTHLSDSNHFAVSAPSCLMQKLRNLSCFTGSSLANDNDHRICLYQVKKAFAMTGDGQQGGRFVKGGNEFPGQIKVAHDVVYLIKQSWLVMVIIDVDDGWAANDSMTS